MIFFLRASTTNKAEGRRIFKAQIYQSSNRYMEFEEGKNKSRAERTLECIISSKLFRLGHVTPM